MGKEKLPFTKTDFCEGCEYENENAGEGVCMCENPKVMDLDLQQGWTMKTYYVFVYNHLKSGESYVTKAWVLEEDLLNFINLVLDMGYQAEVIQRCEEEDLGE